MGQPHDHSCARGHARDRSARQHAVAEFMQPRIVPHNHEMPAGFVTVAHHVENHLRRCKIEPRLQAHRLRRQAQCLTKLLRRLQRPLRRAAHDALRRLHQGRLSSSAKIGVEQKAGDRRCRAQTPFVQRAIMIVHPRLIPTRFCVADDGQILHACTAERRM